MGAGVLMFIDSFLPWYGASFRARLQQYGQRLALRLRGLVLDHPGDRRRRRGRGAGLRRPHLACRRRRGGQLGVHHRRGERAGRDHHPAALADLPQCRASRSTARARKFGTYIGLIVAIVQTVFGYLSIVPAGERLPWQNRAPPDTDV